MEIPLFLEDVMKLLKWWRDWNKREDDEYKKLLQAITKIKQEDFKSRVREVIYEEREEHNEIRRR